MKTTSSVRKQKSLAKKNEVIGIMGARGSFSEEAARAYAEKNGITDFTLSYLINAEPVLTALEAGEITLAIFPIENNNGGIVQEAVEAMSGHNFSIQKIFDIPIHHNLLVVKGTRSEDIKRIASHDQALKQCRMYLKRFWPKATLEVYIDTAKAAADLAKGEFPKGTAVIAPRAAAKLYKLDVLEESIQDLKWNYTSFIAATRRK